jgi:putative hydrolase of the HAD superfamily
MRPARDVRTILFDVGNTLTFVDAPRMGEILAGAGASCSSETLRQAEERARRALYTRALSNDPGSDAARWIFYLNEFLGSAGIRPETEIDRLRTLLAESHRQENLWRRVPQGTRDVLQMLRAAGYRLGVVSNADGRVAQLLRDLALHEFFETIIDSHHVGFEKPDPAIFACALNELGAAADSAVYVGDMYAVDVLGARAAGLDAILLDPLEIANEMDCLVIRDLRELPEILRIKRS